MKLNPELLHYFIIFAPFIKYFVEMRFCFRYTFGKVVV